MLTHPQFDPVALSLGPVQIHWYGLTYVVAFGLFLLLARRRAARPWFAHAGWSAADVEDLLFYGVIGVVLGGRIGYALFYKPELYGALFSGLSWGDRLALVRLWDGGMSFHGGMIGTTLAVVIFAWRNKLATLSIGDMALAAAPFGLFFGRVANFINGELWGRETTVPWAVRFCNARIEQMYGFCPAGDVPRHPSQLYEAGLEGIALFVILWLAVFKWRLLAKPGYVTGLFLFGYGLARATLETFRQPDFGMENLLLGLTMGMMLSIPMMIIGGWLIWRARTRPPVVA